MKKRTDINPYILNNLQQYPATIVPITAKRFGISKQRVHHYLNNLIKDGVIIKIGKTSATRYFLANGNIIEFELKLGKETLSEDRVWAKYVKPILLQLPKNIYTICNHGFTEIYNNAIDHSEGSTIHTMVRIEEHKITITICDDGVGIFHKIQESLGLESSRESILHLSKGKFTTDPKHHSGQGIFFTSRIFDEFSILSDNLFYIFSNGDWVLSHEKPKPTKGTFISMHINLNANTVLKDVFDSYSGIETGFAKTVVAVRLSQDPDDPHVSRSQAKRLLIGLDKFKTVLLNFSGVTSVGQAFVDEIFRVYKNEHPSVQIKYINAEKDVEEMIKRGIADSNAYSL